MAVQTGADAGSAEGRSLSSAAVVLQRLRSHTLRRLGWGVADQGVSSLTNFAISIYVVHSLGAVQFGAFSLAYVTYGFALSASRGLSTDPLMIRYSGVDVPTWRRAVAQCTGTAVNTGLIIGACVLAAAAVVSGAARASFLALGLTLPALLLQDSWRYSFFALGRGVQAFINDSIWAVLLFPALFFLRKTGHADVFWFVSAWGLTAAIAAAVGPWQARVVPRPSGAWEWVTRQRHLGPPYLMEGVSGSVALQLRSYGVGAVLGFGALGAVQASTTLFGPITILFTGISLVAIPEGARVLRRSPRRLPLFCLAITAALSAAGLAWGIILLFAVPRGLGAWLLGPVWRSAYPLLLPQMICVIAGGIGYGAGMGLHALGAARRTLHNAFLWAGLYVIFAVGGAFAGGAEGTVWGAAVAPCVCAVYGWWQLREAMREYGRSAPGKVRLPGRSRVWPPRMYQSSPSRVLCEVG